jgi:hypothetical protein
MGRISLIGRTENHRRPTVLPLGDQWFCARHGKGGKPVHSSGGVRVIPSAKGLWPYEASGEDRTDQTDRSDRIERYERYRGDSLRKLLTLRAAPRRLFLP